MVAVQFPALPCCCFRAAEVPAVAPVTWSLSSRQCHGRRQCLLPNHCAHGGGIATAPRRGRRRIECVGWDPENILSPPQPGHIARRSFEKQYKDEEERKSAIEEAARVEREKRRVARAARSVPETNAGLVKFLLDTKGQEMEYEIARCRPRLNEDFFSFIKSEIGFIRSGLNPQEGSEEMLVELDALQKLLVEGTEAYDKLASDFVGAKDRLTEIFASKDKRVKLLELAGQGKLDRPLLALLDENIATARKAGQGEAAEFMGRIRGAMVKYMTT